MKIYLASKFENSVLMPAVADYIWKQIGAEFVSDWYFKTDGDEDIAALMDFKQVSECDVLVASGVIGPGVASEMGYALALGKTVYFVHHDGYEPPILPIFHPDVIHCKSLPLLCLELLKRRQPNGRRCKETKSHPHLLWGT